MRIHLFLIIFMTLSIGELPARERMALVIGNADYHFSPLVTATNDARDVAAALRQSGFRVTLKLDVDQQSMESAINQFAQSLHANSEALFYYAGHGAQAKHGERDNYLIPVGSIPNISSAADLRYKTVSASWVLSKMSESASPLKIMILDACRDAPFRGFNRSLRGGLARMPTADGTLIAYATAPNRKTRDHFEVNDRNSPYTKHLLKFMQHPGLTLEQVLKNTRREVKDITDGEQKPWYESSLDGDFYFSGSAAGNTTGNTAGSVEPQFDTSASGASGAELIQPPTAKLTIRSDQYNDQVWLNGKVYGATPVTFDLPLGRYQLKVTKAGFQAYEKWLNVQADMQMKAALERKKKKRSQPTTVPSTSSPSKQGTRISRYIAYDDGTALDTVTGLLWMRCLVGQTWIGSTCTGKAKTFEWEAARTQTANFAGHSDWRIPSIEELRSLVYCSHGKPAYFNNGKPGREEYIAQGHPDNFDWGCQGQPNKDHERPTLLQSVFPTPKWHWLVWSGSPSATYSDYAWYVGFSSGNGSNYGRYGSGHIRLVRGGQ